jgi:hypothetical protein
LKDENIRRGKVIGKVGLFLESVELGTSNSNQKMELDDLQNRIDELESKISRDSKQEKLDAIINKINLQMSNWAQYLDLEYDNASIRFNPNQLMLYADTDDQSIPLTKMGSGAQIGFLIIYSFILGFINISFRKIDTCLVFLF